jgi:hypothetical protein
MPRDTPHAQGWLISAEEQTEGAQVDLPVEEFLFRLDPAVSQVLDQGVPISECTINIHANLKKSYEKLTFVHLLGPINKDEGRGRSAAARELRYAPTQVWMLPSSNGSASSLCLSICISMP